MSIIIKMLHAFTLKISKFSSIDFSYLKYKTFYLLVYLVEMSFFTELCIQYYKL